MDAELHVLFGAGQVGHPLARRLLTTGKRVRVVKRTAGHVPPACEVVLGDAEDQAFCVQAARGATVLYHCMNPPYDARIWADKVPRYMDNLIAAASQTGARLVVLDNVYMLGRPDGHSLNEDTPINPCSRKGEIRARAAERLFDAHRRGDVAAISGRASDFYGPGGTLTGLGDFFWPRALAGKTAYSPYPLDATHTYHYIPDVAAGLAALGCAEIDVYGRPWMLPCAPPGTLRDLVQRLASKLDRPIRVAQLPRWMVKMTAVVMPLMRELDEMLYQWDEPFVVDDRKFRERFNVMPVAADTAATETIDWATQHYAQAAAPPTSG
jgi:nucleoside-diphosphate-sugar epimerase